MKYMNLGTTDIEVSRICIGGMSFGKVTGSGTQSVVASKCSGADVKQGIAIRGSTAQSSKNSEIEELDTWLSSIDY